MNDTRSEQLSVPRRGLLRGAGQVALSTAALALLAGGARPTRAAAGPTEADAIALNAILGLDHEAIAAYEIAAGSGLLSAGVLPVARLFQGHHIGHRDELIAVIRAIGAEPVEAKSIEDYAVDIGAAALTSELDILKLAAQLEGAAVNAYVGTLATLADKDHARLVAQLVADETMHWTVLTTAVGDALPTGAFAFGA
ncbi:MAG: ferritin-like domain-containing protein [Alphaproteobacteria bacterium]